MPRELRAASRALPRKGQPQPSEVVVQPDHEPGGASRWRLATNTLRLPPRVTARNCHAGPGRDRGDEVRVVGQLGKTRSDPAIGESPGAPGSEPGTARTGKMKRRSQSGIDAEKAAPDAPGNGACE